MNSLLYYKNFSTRSTIIRIKYSKTQSQSLIYLPVNFLEYVEIMTFFSKKLGKLNKLLNYNICCASLDYILTYKSRKLVSKNDKYKYFSDT